MGYYYYFACSIQNLITLIKRVIIIQKVIIILSPAMTPHFSITISYPYQSVRSSGEMLGFSKCILPSKITLLLYYAPHCLHSCEEQITGIQSVIVLY